MQERTGKKKNSQKDTNGDKWFIMLWHVKAKDITEIGLMNLLLATIFIAFPNLNTH